VLSELAFCQIFLGFSPPNYGFSLMFSVADARSRDSWIVLPGNVDTAQCGGVTQACFRAALKTNRQRELIRAAVRHFQHRASLSEVNSDFAKKLIFVFYTCGQNWIQGGSQRLGITDREIEFICIKIISRR
jgi:hypothetical protein